MRRADLFPIILRCFFALAACGTIADVANPDTVYESPDAAILQGRLITHASGDLFRADQPASAIKRATATRDDGTNDTPKIAFSPITGSTPGARPRWPSVRLGAVQDTSQVSHAPVHTFRRDRAHRIRDGGDLSDSSTSPITGDTAPHVQGGYSCPRRIE